MLVSNFCPGMSVRMNARKSSLIQVRKDNFTPLRACVKEINVLARLLEGLLISFFLTNA